MTSNDMTSIHRVVYSDIKYPDTHWAIRTPAKELGLRIGVVRAHGFEYACKLNATDRRGFRMLVVLTGEDSLNREYTQEEIAGLFSVLSGATCIYNELGFLAQCEIAGNNSHSLDESGNVVVGKSSEPSMCHGHIIARGNPDSVLEGLQLHGPPAGALFNMRGNGSDAGNEKKIPWTTSDEAAPLVELLKAKFTAHFGESFTPCA